MKIIIVDLRVKVGGAPMDKAEVVYGLYGERALGHVKSRDIFRENIVFHQHRH
jgi:hypothetical protein